MGHFTDADRWETLREIEGLIDALDPIPMREGREAIARFKEQLRDLEMDRTSWRSAAKKYAEDLKQVGS